MKATRLTTENGQVVWEGVTFNTLITHAHFEPVASPCTDENVQVALHTNLGSLTVLRRMTGFGWWDTETGFRDIDGKFWLASGNMDVRQLTPIKLASMIEWVKLNANTCNPSVRTENG